MIELHREAEPSKALARNYDYVIVGAGSAGCVVARRLLDGTDATVLLLEAGGPGDGVASLSNPPQWVENLGSPYDWAVHYEPSPHVAHRAIPCRSERCSADQAASTRWSGPEATGPITRTGRRPATLAGTSIPYCRSSSKPRTGRMVRVSSAARAAQSASSARRTCTRRRPRSSTLAGRTGCRTSTT